MAMSWFKIIETYSRGLIMTSKDTSLWRKLIWMGKIWCTVWVNTSSISMQLLSSQIVPMASSVTTSSTSSRIKQCHLRPLSPKSSSSRSIKTKEIKTCLGEVDLTLGEFRKIQGSRPKLMKKECVLLQLRSLTNTSRLLPSLSNRHWVFRLN